MKYAPVLTTEIGGLSVSNGQPVRSSDVQHLDRYQTWLAAVRKLHVPSMVFPAGLTSSSVTLAVKIPPFTRAVAWQILAKGVGTWKCENSIDSYDSRITTAAPSADQVNNAVLYKSGDSKDASADGLQRALDVTMDDDWTDATFTLSAQSVTSGDAVYMWRLIFLPANEDSELP